MAQAKHWCFTIFDESFTESTILELTAEHLDYAVWQLERCPESGRLHFQGYCEFKNKKRIGGVKQCIGYDSAHLEKRRGSRDEARAYCRKPDSRIAGPWELGNFGRLGRQGERSDLDTVAERILQGSKLSEIRTEFPTQYIKYRSGIKDLAFHSSKVQTKEWRNLEVLVYYGDAGTGKTRRAVSDSGDDWYILEQGDRVWFDGYESEPILIIDDFYGWIKWGTLLRILDGYRLRCEVKGGFTWAAWTKVIITSNKHPREWYDRGLDPALARRITSIQHFANVGEPQEGV